VVCDPASLMVVKTSKEEKAFVEVYLVASIGVKISLYDLLHADSF